MTSDIKCLYLYPQLKLAENPSDFLGFMSKYNLVIVIEEKEPHPITDIKCLNLQLKLAENPLAFVGACPKP